jgi:cell division protein FtsW (lipid II flippase)
MRGQAHDAVRARVDALLGDARVEAYLDAVLAQVRLREAHHELRAELSDHLGAALHDLLDEGLDDDGAIQLAVARMGSPEQTGSALDDCHPGRLDRWLIGAVLLVTGLGGLALTILIRSGASPTARPSKLLWHGLATLGGLGLALALTRIDPRRWQRLALWALPSTWLLIGLAWLLGPRFAGRPYLSLGPLQIDVLAVSPYLLIVGVAALLVRRWRGRFPPKAWLRGGQLGGLLVSAVTALSVAVLTLSGARGEAALFALAASVITALAASWARRWLPLTLALVCVLLIMLPAATQELAPRVVWGSYAESDALLAFLRSARGARGGLSPQIEGAALAALALAAGLLIALRCFAIARATSLDFGRALAAGLGVALLATTLWNVLASPGLVGAGAELPMPVHGLVFPLFGYSGTRMVAQLALLGVVLAIGRTRTLTPWRG